MRQIEKNEIASRWLARAIPKTKELNKKKKKHALSVVLFNRLKKNKPKEHAFSLMIIPN